MPTENRSLIASIIERITAIQIGVTVINLAMIAAVVWFIVDRGQDKDKFLGEFVTFLAAIGGVAVVLLIVLYIILNTTTAEDSIGNQLIAMVRLVTPMQVVGMLIALLTIGGMIWIIYTGAGFFDDSTKARGLLTYSVAIVTVAIALILIFYLVFSDGEDLKDRFSYGKDILMVFVGILGTIMGFYYGADKVTPKNVTDIASAVSNPGGKSDQRDEWIIVVGTDVSVDEAKVELEKALTVSAAAKIYKRGDQFRTVIPGFASREDAMKILPQAKTAVNATSYVLDLKTWCRNPKDLGDYIECQTNGESNPGDSK